MAGVLVHILSVKIQTPVPTFVAGYYISLYQKQLTGQVISMP